MPTSEIIPGLLLLTAVAMSLVILLLLWAILRRLGRSSPPRWRDNRDDVKPAPRPAPPQPDGERLVPRVNAETAGETWTPPRRTQDREQASAEDIVATLTTDDQARLDHARASRRRAD